ncbi:MAG: hypothetical protein ABII18_06540 [bacterium]
MDKCDYVLIDDDPIIHASWTFVAKSKGKVVRCYAKANEFIQEIGMYHKETPIYIDSNLGENVRGEIVAKNIHEKGFENIYLATGYNPEEFTQMPWIKAVVGKEPPFLFERL